MLYFFRLKEQSGSHRFFQLNFETSGQIVDISQTPEDTIYLSHSNLALPFDNELGKSPISLGHWVNVTGELGL